MVIDTVRAGIIDDHEAVRIGFAASAARDARLNSPPVVIVGMAATVSEFLNSPTGPGVSVALDMSLADGSRPGDNVARLVSAGHKVLVFTLGDNLASLQDALANGAVGVAHKSESMTQTFGKLRRVAAGETIASQELAAAIDVDTEFVEAVLSERERECLSLYADGFGQYQVARRMGVAESTVKQNIDRVREKYAAAGRPAYTKIDLYRRAVEDGILPPLLPRRKP